MVLVLQDSIAERMVREADTDGDAELKFGATIVVA